jgi:hypothetical protein
MVYRGTIKDGGVVLPADVTLPEGTEVLVAVPDPRAEPAAGLAIRERLTEPGSRADASPSDLPPNPALKSAPCADQRSGQDGPAEEPRDYPVADFISPIGYDWNEDVYAAEEAVRAYLSDSHADY